MSTNAPNNQEDQEIDLEQISKKVKSFFQGINESLFHFIQFFIKNGIIIAALFLIGVGLGWYLDQTNKSYSSEIIVSPNFGSTDYLYSKVDLLTSKVKENDAVFLKSIGLNNPLDIKKIKIEPIVDIYRFINNNEQNLDLLKLMAEDSDLKTVVKETATSKNYSFHTITYTTSADRDSKTNIQAILNYLNNSDYYKKIQKVSIVNTENKLKADELSIAQIDGILNEFSNTTRNQQKSDKLVYYNENTQLNDVLKTKELLTKDIGNLRLELLNSDKIIKESTIVLNLENNKILNSKLKFILPFLFILGFVFVMAFIKFYKHQSSLLNSRN